MRFWRGFGRGGERGRGREWRVGARPALLALYGIVLLKALTLARPGAKPPTRTQKELEMSLFGLGLYTVSQSSQLTGIPTASVRRWMGGYVQKGVTYSPLWLPEVDLDELVISFRDLMELRSVYALKKEGISVQTIRKAIAAAVALIGVDRPLSTSRFRTDGRKIFLQIEPADDNEAQLIEVFTRQINFKSIVEQSLKDVVFDGIFPAAWRPAGGRAGIIVDPLRNFGHPIDEVSGVSTQSLYESYAAEGSIERVAQIYEVPKQVVKRAVAFQGGLAKAA